MRKTGLFMILIFSAVLLLQGNTCVKTNQITPTTPTKKANQPKPKLAILPFSGGTAAERETLAKLFSYDSEISKVFKRVPHTSSVDAIMKEQKFVRTTGLTDSDTIAKLGNQDSPDYVLAGHIQKLGSKKLVHITIIELVGLQQIAGDYTEYDKIDDVKDVIPDMADVVAKASIIDRSKMPTLAIFPFEKVLTKNDAEVLAQILATEIANTGQYKVLPRMSGLDAAMKELKIQRSGLIKDEDIKKIGNALNAKYVLSGHVSTSKTGGEFLVEVMDIEKGGLRGGDRGGASENYKTVAADGLEKMRLIARKITGTGVAMPVNFVRIVGGSFMIGSPASEVGRDKNETQSRVTVKSFYMSKHQVTQKEWKNVMGTTVQQEQKNSKKSGIYGAGDNFPMFYVSWYKAIEYCNKRSLKEGLTPAYTITEKDVKMNRNASGYRLPTEAEWEYACRATTTTPFNTGKNITSDQANYDGRTPYDKNAKGIYKGTTTIVGTYAPNKFELFDMHGNVWEWCWDWYGEVTRTPMGPATGVQRVARGGSWKDKGQNLRSAYRNKFNPEEMSSDIGFRVIRVP